MVAVVEMVRVVAGEMFWSKLPLIQSSYLLIPRGSVEGSKIKVGELELRVELLAGEIRIGILGCWVAGFGEGVGGGTVAETGAPLVSGLARTKVGKVKKVKSAMVGI